MSPVTADPSRNFQEFSPPPARDIELLPELFAMGDADPRSPLGPGAENALRLNRAREVIASRWGLSHDHVIFVADRSLAFHLAILGSLTAGTLSQIAYSPIEKKEVLAIIESIDPTVERLVADVDAEGSIQNRQATSALHVHQMRNGETGILQATMPRGPVLLDATSLQPQPLSLPRDWRAVILDASSWCGPRGVYPLAINPAHPWRNPLPTLDPTPHVFGSNYALTLLAAVALESYLSFDPAEFDEANQKIRSIVDEVDEVDVAGSSTGDRLSLSFLYVQSEELQRRLFHDGFLVDSGSACSSSALEPSHVLTSMGLLSQGNVRLRFRPENCDQAEHLARTLVHHVRALREEL